MTDGGLLDEIFVALGFKVDDKKVKDFHKEVDGVMKSLKRAITVTAGAVIAVDRFTNALLKANQAYINFNQQTGLSIDSMNKLIGAGMLSNYNLMPEAMMSGVQALQSNLAAISIGQGNIAPFQILGINPIGKDATQVLEDLRVAIQGVDDAMAVNLMQQMGLSPEFISMLRLSTEEMNRLNAAAQQYMLTSSQRQALNQFAMELRLVHMEMSYLKDRAIIAIAPHLIKFLDRFTKILEVMFEYRKILMWMGVGGVTAIMAMDKAIKVLGVTINRTFGKWLAALTAIYLLLEDLAIWKMGGQSLIGDLYEWGQRGFSKDPEEKTTDELHEELYGTKRTGLQKYLDWLGSGGFIGTMFGANKTQHDMYKRMLETKNGGAVGNLTSNQNLQQNNYISVGSAPEAIGQQIAEYAFAYLQVDQTK